MELSPRPRGGAHARSAEVESALPEAHPTKNATSNDPNVTASRSVAVEVLRGSLRMQSPSAPRRES
jgi:hypothetical protein